VVLVVLEPHLVLLAHLSQGLAVVALDARQQVELEALAVVEMVIVELLLELLEPQTPEVVVAVVLLIVRDMREVQA
jgi:hypothetical protein